MAANLYVGNDNDVYLQGYRVAATGVAVTDALATFTVYDLGGYDADGNPIRGPAIGALAGVAMPMVTSVPGDYRGLIPGTYNLTVGSPYYIVVTFSNYNDTFSGWFPAGVRTGN
jgi:hypothetical protein